MRRQLGVLDMIELRENQCQGSGVGFQCIHLSYTPLVEKCCLWPVVPYEGKLVCFMECFTSFFMRLT